jgi:hypothetical protein
MISVDVSVPVQIVLFWLQLLAKTNLVLLSTLSSTNTQPITGIALLSLMFITVPLLLVFSIAWPLSKRMLPLATRFLCSDPVLSRHDKQRVTLRIVSKFYD